MDWSTVISTVVGVIAGGLVNAYFSRRGSRELRREANEIKKYNVMLIDFLDDAGVIDVKRDAKGNATQIRVVKVEHDARATGVATHQTKVIRHGDAQQQSDNADQ
jgi:hypothetical protein